MRRGVMTAAVTVALAMAAGTSGLGAEDAAPTGADVLARLRAGNRAFVERPGAPLPTAAPARAGQPQAPLAAVLSCADSRVPPEVVFHTGLGDLFVVRDAGNVTDRAVIGSVEYAVRQLHVPLVIVMGHESCDTVKAAMEPTDGERQGPNLDFILAAIRPAIAASAGRSEAERMRVAILSNVENSLNDLMKQSSMLRESGEAGRVMFVGAYYELSTGRVHLSDPVRLGPSPAPHHTGGQH